MVYRQPLLAIARLSEQSKSDHATSCHPDVYLLSILYKEAANNSCLLRVHVSLLLLRNRIQNQPSGL